MYKFQVGNIVSCPKGRLYIVSHDHKTLIPIGSANITISMPIEDLYVEDLEYDEYLDEEVPVKRLAIYGIENYKFVAANVQDLMIKKFTQTFLSA